MFWRYQYSINIHDARGPGWYASQCWADVTGSQKDAKAKDIKFPLTATLETVPGTRRFDCGKSEK